MKELGVTVELKLRDGFAEDFKVLCDACLAQIVGAPINDETKERLKRMVADGLIYDNVFDFTVTPS